jgi:hypothetical protein
MVDCILSVDHQEGTRILGKEHHEMAGGDHFYTISKAERNQCLGSGWKDEGIECCVLTPYVEIKEGVPSATYKMPALFGAQLLWRMFNPKAFDHYYAPALSDNVSRALSGGWLHEGGSAIVFSTFLSFHSHWYICIRCRMLIRVSEGRQDLTPRQCPSAPGEQHDLRLANPYTTVELLATDQDVGPGFQKGWSECTRCNSLFFEQHPGRCPASNGNHVSALGLGGQTVLCHSQPTREGHAIFRWCNKCSSLWAPKSFGRPDKPFSSNIPRAACPAGGTHNGDSWEYNLHCYSPELDGKHTEGLMQMWKGGDENDHLYCTVSGISENAGHGYAAEGNVAYVFPANAAEPVSEMNDVNREGNLTPFYRLYVPVPEDPSWFEEAWSDFTDWVSNITPQDVLKGVAWTGVAAVAAIFAMKSIKGGGVDVSAGQDGDIYVTPKEP